jgi:hypothetical protein
MTWNFFDIDPRRPEGIHTRLGRFLYNLDRALGSLMGAGPQETISSAAGRAKQRGAWWGRALCWGLNKLDKCHCEKAVKHADDLGKADDGFTG